MSNRTLRKNAYETRDKLEEGVKTVNECRVLMGLRPINDPIFNKKMIKKVQLNS